MRFELPVDEGIDDFSLSSIFRTTKLALQAMMRCAKMVIMPHNGQPTVIRIGLHTGPIVTGLVGEVIAFRKMADETA